MQNRLEAVVVSLEVFLFYKGLSFEDFFSLVTDMYNLADKVGVPLNKFPSHIKELKDKIDVLRNDIDQLEKKKQDALSDFNLTLELLQEYNANKPFLETISNLKKLLADAKGRIRELEGELDNERRSNDQEEQDIWSVFETKLENAKNELIPSVEIPFFMNTIKDVFKHPSRYLGAIRLMRDIYRKYHEITSVP